MKQSCYFAKVCDREFNKKHIGVNVFSLQLCVHAYRLTISYEYDTNVVSICWGLLLEDSTATAGSFHKSYKLMAL